MTVANSKKKLSVVADAVLKTISNNLQETQEVSDRDVNTQTYTSIVDILPAGCTSENIADAASRLYAELKAVQPLSDRDVDKETVKEFLQHINNQINNMPVGGYDQPEDSQVVITVGRKSFVFYDHASLMQSLITGLTDLLEEI